MKRPLLTDALASRPLCCDGAMGTQLLARGLASGASGMLWNVERAADVRQIHEAYRTAGCDLITTNSFGGSVTALDLHKLAGRAAELNKAAAEVARAAAGEEGWVLADVGPFGGFLEPLGETTKEELRGIFSRQIEALLAGGADAVLVETMSDPAEAVIGVQAAKACDAKTPVIVTYAFQKRDPGEFCTMMGASVKEVVEAAIDAGAEIVGANCGTSLSLADYVELARQLVASADGAPVIVQPNAGSPRVLYGRLFYGASPDEMAAAAVQLASAGVRIIGGCCGTSPEHLGAMCQAVRKSRSQSAG